MTDCFAIRRPDGSYIVDTRSLGSVRAWHAAMRVERRSRTGLEEDGYTCVRVKVEELPPE